jgi:ankyrin repeat protein
VTATFLASQAGYLDILELLIKAGADPDTQSQVTNELADPDTQSQTKKIVSFSRYSVKGKTNELV